MASTQFVRRTSIAFAATLALAACGSGESTESIGEIAGTTVPVATAGETETTLASSAPADTTPADDTTSETAPSETAPSDTAPEEIASADRPADWDPNVPYGYGDDEDFDALWDGCENGDSDDCDTLFWTSPADSAYETYALDNISLFDGTDDRETTGDPLADALAMERPADWDASEPFTYGDDAEFDALWDGCKGGDSDDCSSLFWSSPADSAYEAYGLDSISLFDGPDRETTGDPLADALAMERPADWDADEPFTYGDDAGFDALWDGCKAGDSDDCSSLFWSSPSDSAYEAYGLDSL